MKSLLLIIHLCLLSCIPQILRAQVPLVFESICTEQIQTDELTHLFISPQQAVWKYAGDGGSVRHEEEDVLKPGNSQAEMGKKGICEMVSTENRRC